MLIIWMLTNVQCADDDLGPGNPERYVRRSDSSAWAGRTPLPSSKRGNTENGSSAAIDGILVLLDRP